MTLNYYVRLWCEKYNYTVVVFNLHLYLLLVILTTDSTHTGQGHCWQFSDFLVILRKKVCTTKVRHSSATEGACSRELLPTVAQYPANTGFFFGTLYGTKRFLKSWQDSRHPWWSGSDHSRLAKTLFGGLLLKHIGCHYFGIFSLTQNKLHSCISFLIVNILENIDTYVKMYLF